MLLRAQRGLGRMEWPGEPGVEWHLPHGELFRLLRRSGFDVVDLGTDVPPTRFVSAVTNDRADIVGLSALLTTTMLQMKATLKTMETAGVRGSVKVIIGGAPVTQRFADEIGADGYADNAAAALALARRLMAPGA